MSLKKFNLEPDSPAERTYALELRRSVAAGILETAGTTFLLLIAVRWFEMGPTAKALIAGGGNVGLLLAPLALYFVSHLGMSASRAAAVGFAFSALATLGATLFPGPQSFVLLNVLAIACWNSCVPFFTQVYHENYPDSLRGRLFARTYNVRVLSSILFGALAGYALSGRLQFFQLLLLVYAGCFAYSALCMFRIRSSAPNQGHGETLTGGFRFILEDTFFRNTLICWMIMGFGNLMMWPLRVEYLAAEKYGLNLSTTEVALFIVVLPNIARVLMNPLWGRLFDRIDFQYTRLLANLGFVFGVLAFFFSDNMLGLSLGAVCYGIGISGGDITWNLWITKCAPVSRAAAYMSVHTCLTGLRAVIAPFVAFYLITGMSITNVAWISAGMILFANVFLFLPGSRLPGQNRSGSPSVEAGPEL